MGFSMVLPRRLPALMATRARSSRQRGFTLVEVMVAILVLLVGVLGVVAMVDGANAVTSKTKSARRGHQHRPFGHRGVALGPVSRPHRRASLEAALSSRPGLADASGAPGYTISQRGVAYEMTLTVCSLDDPKDQLGNMPAGVVFCADSDVLAPGQPGVDRNPDDYKRVRVTLNWTTRGTDSERHPDVLDHQPRRRSRPVGHRPDDDLPGLVERRAGPDREHGRLGALRGGDLDLRRRAQLVRGRRRPGQGRRRPDQLDLRVGPRGRTGTSATTTAPT